MRGAARSGTHLTSREALNPRSWAVTCVTADTLGARGTCQFEGADGGGVGFTARDVAGAALVRSAHSVARRPGCRPHRLAADAGSPLTVAAAVAAYSPAPEGDGRQDFSARPPLPVRQRGEVPRLLDRRTRGNLRVHRAQHEYAPEPGAEATLRRILGAFVLVRCPATGLPGGDVSLWANRDFSCDQDGSRPAPPAGAPPPTGRRCSAQVGNATSEARSRLIPHLQQPRRRHRR